MRIFGGILPFIGFREEEVDAEMRRLYPDIPGDVKTLDTFQIEWLGVAIVFAAYKVPGDEK